jgi:hypothetical protein
MRLDQLTRIAVDAVRGAMPLPDWRAPDPDRSEQTRDWLRRLYPALPALAQNTATTIDQATVSLVERILDSDELWGAVWTITNQRIFGHREDAKTLATFLGGVCARVDGNSGSTDPAIVLGLIDAVVDLAGAIREQAGPGPPLPAEAAADQPLDPDIEAPPPKTGG